MADLCTSVPKIKILYKTFLFARANSSPFESFSSTKCRTIPNRPLLKHLQKQSIITDRTLCIWLAQPHYSDHLQRQRSQRTVPITKYWPIPMIQIICKNKVLSLTTLFPRAESSLSGSFENQTSYKTYYCKGLKNKMWSWSYGPPSLQQAGQ